MTKAQRRALRRQLKNTIDFQQKAKEKKSLELEAKSVNQQNYIDNLIDQKTSIVVAQGPAGTGNIPGCKSGNTSIEIQTT